MSWQAAVERTVSGLGYDLVDTEYLPRGLLRVTIDRLVGDPTGEFITVEDCERVTRQLQHVLEVEGSSYERLEVSSPGLDRPLKKPADFDRFAGSVIELTLRQPFQGRKRYKGELQPSESAPPAGSAASAWRVIFNDGKEDQALDFSLEEVRDARLVPVVDFKGRRSAPAPAVGDESRRDEGEGARKE